MTPSVAEASVLSSLVPTFTKLQVIVRIYVFWEAEIEYSRWERTYWPATFDAMRLTMVYLVYCPFG